MWILKKTYAFSLIAIDILCFTHNVHIKKCIFVVFEEPILKV